MKKYVIGLDFGTLSARALLCDASNGDEIVTAASDYAHGVMDRALPTGEPLPHDWALQHPQDYIDALFTIIPSVMRQSGVSPADVIGVGLDTTGCTLLPVASDLTPLCLSEKYRHEKHAWVKLWKHHSTAPYAERIDEIAHQRGETFLSRYGDKVSSEWLLPKVLETLSEAPEVYHDAAYFIELMDYIVWLLTGELCRSACALGYKAFWSKREGFPSDSFYSALDPRLSKFPEEKLAGKILSTGERAGFLTKEAAEKLGLLPGTPVAIGTLDAHVAAPALSVTEEGQMFAVLGTSGCHMVPGKKELIVPGICGYVEDGIIPGFFGYEAGQSCFGDLLGWYVQNAVPAEYTSAAAAKGMDIHSYLTEKASALRVGESGLLALDWWNGNRSVLADFSLSGLMVGMTLRTRPEEIYRALLESVAFGTRAIVENYRAYGVPVHELIATGGIVHKNPLLMQILADVLRFPVRIGASREAPALGSAVCAACAAGKESGGYDTLIDAARSMGRVSDLLYTPIEDHSAVYDALYGEYKRLHDLFGRGGVDTMKKLRAIAAHA